MALQWEPQWEEVVVEYRGIRLKALRDRVTGVYACPICGLGERATYLFTVKDYVFHIYSHARRFESQRIAVAQAGEEGEEEGELEEE